MFPSLKFSQTEPFSFGGADCIKLTVEKCIATRIRKYSVCCSQLTIDLSKFLKKGYSGHFY
jgi:hypothetical protein